MISRTPSFSVGLAAPSRCRRRSPPVRPRSSTTRAGETHRRANTPQNATLTEEQRSEDPDRHGATDAFRPVVQATGNVAFNGDRSTQVLSPVSGPATRVVVDAGHGRHARASRSRTSRRPTSRPPSPTIERRRRRFATPSASPTATRRCSRTTRSRARDLEQAQADVAAAEADLDAAMQNMRALGVEEAQIDAVRQGKHDADRGDHSRRRSTAPSSRS